MSLFRRVRRLVSANVQEMIERVEDPAVLLKQSLRDIDRQLAGVLDAAVRVSTDEKLLARQIAQLQTQIAEFTESARAAVARGDDKAGRTALRRRAEHRDIAETLSAEVASVSAAANRLRDHLEYLRSRRREAHARLSGLLARQQAAVASRRAVLELAGCGEEAALSEFDRLAARVERSELEAAARIEMLPFDAPAPLENDAEIERELAQLKSELNG
jgi:phage shock protein A